MSQSFRLDNPSDRVFLAKQWEKLYLKNVKIPSPSDDDLERVADLLDDRYEIKEIERKLREKERALFS